MLRLSGRLMLRTLCLIVSTVSVVPFTEFLRTDLLPPQVVHTTSLNSHVTSVAGGYAAVMVNDSTTSADLWLLNLSNPEDMRPFKNTPAAERQGSLSPDGHWMAYVSNESGSPEVYVEPVPGPGGRRQDLCRRLRRTRWPDTDPGAVNLGDAMWISDYWLNEYDWRAQERVLNGGAFRGRRLPARKEELWAQPFGYPFSSLFRRNRSRCRIGRSKSRNAMKPVCDLLQLDGRHWDRTRLRPCSRAK